MIERSDRGTTVVIIGIAENVRLECILLYYTVQCHRY